MIYLFTLLALIMLNGMLLWKMTGLISLERDTIEILTFKMREMDMVVKDFNENFKPEMEAHMKKCLLHKGINENTVDVVTTTGKSNDK